MFSRRNRRPTSPELAAARERLAPRIRRWCLGHGVGHASAAEIDEIGIMAALRLAGERALAQLDLRPDLEKQIAFGEAEGALRGLVSGSGPTCVYLCESGDHARAVAGALVASAGDAAPPVVLVANGPVAGAHVVEYTQLEDHR